MQMRGQPRGAIAAGQVALTLIFAGMVGEVFQLLTRAHLARSPLAAKATGPVGLARQQVPVWQLVRGGPLLWRGDRLWHRQRLRWRQHLMLQGAPERREDLERRARSSQHRTCGREVISVMQFQRQRLAHRTLGIAPPRLVMVQRVDLPRASFGSELRQHRLAAPAPQDQPRALGLQRRSQTGERMVQPPPARPAHLAVLRGLIVKHVDGHHGPGGAGGDQRGLIGQPQIAAQPQQYRFAHDALRSPAGMLQIRVATAAPIHSCHGKASLPSHAGRPSAAAI